MDEFVRPEVKKVRGERNWVIKLAAIEMDVNAMCIQEGGKADGQIQGLWRFK